ncbi:MAG: DNA translocase FtsK [Bacteroidales bacterium]
MNKKKPDNKEVASKPAFFRKTKNVLGSEMTHFITGMCILMFAAFLFLSFLSFFFTGDADQSKLENLPISQLTDVRNELQNWTGFIGAYLAELFINRWVGISSFMLCLFFGATGLHLMKIKEYKLLPIFFYSNVILIWGSLFFGFFFISGYEDSFIYLGGMHGYYMSLLLRANIGWFGTFLVLIVSFLIISSLLYHPTMDYIRKVLHLNLPDISSWASFLQKKPKEQTVACEPEFEVEMEEALTPTPVTVAPASINKDPYDYLAEEEIKPVSVTSPAQKKQKEHDYILADAHDEPHENPHWIQKNACEVNKPAPTFPDLESKEFIATEKITEPDEIEEEAAFIVNKGHSEEEELVDHVQLEDYDPTLDLSRYKFPAFDLLDKHEGIEKDVDMEEQNANKKRIEETLRNYGIEIQAITATVGPTITLYEIIPKQGVRIAKIRSLEDDIALSLAALGIRIIAPIPGKGTVGIEVPNKDPQMVPMHSIIASRKFQECKYELPVALGKTITNEIFIIDLAKMPHVLVAGATGQGKSVGLNAIITSLLYKKHPSQLKLVLIDPKKVEFNIYSKIERHFLAKLPDEEDAIITDVTKVVATLNSICKEMDERYDLLKAASTRNIKEYNAKFQARVLNPEKGHRYMPYIVVIVDEFGDLIMTAGKEVELPIARIAQLARAVGIHMIIATQRPSTNIITGIIKANFPARVAFRVSSMIDSRTILDTPGANQLIGRGDMLFSQGGDLVRVQCAFVDTPEVEHVSEYIGNQQGYPTAFLLPEYVPEGGSELGDIDLKDRDQIFEEAARLVVLNQQGSTSMIQRKFSIGYNRAGRIMDQLEAAGIVGPFEGSKARQVLVIDEIHLEQILSTLR